MKRECGPRPKGVSLDNTGDYIAIVGPSGSGKTTLLSIIGCLIHPTEERSISTSGGSVISRTLNSRFFGKGDRLRFQFTDLLSNLTVLKTSLSPFSSMTEWLMKRKIRCQLLEKLGLGCTSMPGSRHSPVENGGGWPSPGPDQWPRLLLADEPTGSG